MPALAFVTPPTRATTLNTLVADRLRKRAKKMSPIKRLREMVENASEDNWRVVGEWLLRGGTAVIVAMAGYIFVQVLDGQAENRIAIADAAANQSQLQKENADAMMDLHRLVHDNMASIREIKANRYTVTDAFSAEQRHSEQMDDVKTAISALERRLPTRAEFDALTLLIRDLREDIRQAHKKDGP